MRYSLIAPLLMLLSCVTIPTRQETLSLPILDTKHLPCCWQAQEYLEIDLQGHQFRLSSAIAVTDHSLTVVVLDSLGRRLLTVTQMGNTISVDKSEGVPNALPTDWLLLAIYLRHMPINLWSLATPEWQVDEVDGSRLLTLQGREMIRMRTKNEKYEGDERDVSNLNFPHLQMKMKITRLSRQPI